jgi:tetratricopeptide (TPR) repeat protein
MSPWSLLAVLLLAPPLTGVWQEPAPYTLAVEQLDGEAWCSIMADRAPARELISALAGELGVAVEGLASVPPDARVTVDLRRRPLNEALAWMLGSIGLRAEQRVNTWTLLPAVRADATVEELRDLAVVAYLRATRAHPKHPAAAGAEHSQAQIEEARGNLAAARAHYDTLTESYPGSQLVPEAFLRSGEILERTGQYAQAGQRFEQLLRLEREHPFEAPARTALARCTANQGDWQRALHMVNALDANIPPTTESDLVERQLVRARASIDAGDLATASELLDDVDRRRATRALRCRSFELRARLHESAGEPGPAGRALLALAAELEGTQRAAALLRAARCALAAGDELGALLAAGHVPASDASPEAERAARELRARAREELGLDQPASPLEDTERRLARCEELHDAKLFAEPQAELRALLAEPLDEELRVRALLLLARCESRTDGVDAAVASLREGLPRLTDPDGRRRVYVLAGELYERVERLDEAVDAYRGRL